jgi:hypothetical protein
MPETVLQLATSKAVAAAASTISLRIGMFPLVGSPCPR